MVFAFFLRDNVYFVIAIEIYESRFWIFRIAWKAILWVTEVHTRRRRGCPRIENTYSLSAWKAVPDFYLCNFRDVLPSRQYMERDIVIPAHPRYTRMYGVTHSIAFQAIPCFRNFINGIIVTRAFFRVFHAYRIRRISQKFMLIVMLLRLSFAYVLFSNLS